MARIRYSYPPTRASRTKAGTRKCRFLCCKFGAWQRFFKQTSEIADIASRSILGAAIGKPPPDKVRKLLDKTYRQTHRIWLAEYENLIEADRRAAFLKLLFLNALRYRSCRQMMAVALGNHLVAAKTKEIPSGCLNRHSAKRVRVVMCDVASDAIRQLSNKECLVFLCNLFTDLSDDEIAKLTKLELSTVKAYRREATRILQRRVMKEITKDHELLAILRDESRRNGVAIL